MNSYPSQVEQQMQQFYHSLSEKDRRRYAAIEAVKLGWGGLTYISQLFGCDYYTIRFGIEELNDPSAINLREVRLNPLLLTCQFALKLKNISLLPELIR